MLRQTKLILSFFIITFPIISNSDQPIMNMMPRWDNGYGWQFLYDSICHNDLYLDSSLHKKGFSEEINQLHIQGVYTWDRSIRITAKLPIVMNAYRELVNSDELSSDQKITQKDKGLGDLTLALPLKKYFNLMKRTGSYTLAPQIRIPLRSPDEYNVWDHVFGRGVFAGYETETRQIFFATGVSYWSFDKNKSDIRHANFDFGWNIRNNMQILWETDAHKEYNGKRYILNGPAIYFRQNDHTHYRLEYKKFSKSTTATGQLDHIGGQRFNIGVGFVY